MIKGIGIDIVQIARVEKLLMTHTKRFLERTFTQKEINYCQQKARPAQHYAGRFAAKEALMKAVGKGLVFIDIEIENTAGNPPSINLSGKAKQVVAQAGITNILLSISHDHEYSIAQVVTE